MDTPAPSTTENRAPVADTENIQEGDGASRLALQDSLLVTEVEHICAICFEGIDENQRRSGANCNHVFHDSCLNTWIETQRETMITEGYQLPTSCPLCRANLFDEASTDETGARINEPEQLGEESLQRTTDGDFLTPEVNRPEEQLSNQMGHFSILDEAMRDAGVFPTEDNAVNDNDSSPALRPPRRRAQRSEPLPDFLQEVRSPSTPPTRGMFRAGRRIQPVRLFRPNRGRPYPLPHPRIVEDWGRAPSDVEIIWNRVESVVRAAAMRRETMLNDLREIRRLLTILGL